MKPNKKCPQWIQNHLKGKNRKSHKKMQSKFIEIKYFLSLLFEPKSQNSFFYVEHLG